MTGPESAMEAGRTGAPPPYKSLFPQRATSWLPIVDQGCCCCTLRTCNLVQGWMSLIGGVVNIVKLIYAMCVPNIMKRVCDQDGCHNYLDDNPLQFGNNAWISAMMVILLIWFVIITVVAYLFIKGIREFKPALMVHYIRMCGFSIFLSLVFCTVVAVVLGSALFFLLFIVASGLPLYFLICANSLHIKMSQELEVQFAGPAGAAAAPSVLPPGYGFAAPPPNPYGQPAPPYSAAYPAPDEYPTKTLPE